MTISIVLQFAVVLAAIARRASSSATANTAVKLRWGVLILFGGGPALASAAEANGTGLVRMPQMIRAGFWLNVSGILLVTALTYFLSAPLLLGKG